MMKLYKPQATLYFCRKKLHKFQIFKIFTRFTYAFSSFLKHFLVKQIKTYSHNIVRKTENDFSSEQIFIYTDRLTFILLYRFI